MRSDYLDYIVVLLLKYYKLLMLKQEVQLQTYALLAAKVCKTPKQLSARSQQ